MAGFPNKNALGNKGGSPRTYDRKQIADDLVEWSESPDALKFTMFARYLRLKDGMLFNVTKLPEWAHEDTEFAEAYSIAKQNIDGVSRSSRKNGSADSGACSNQIQMMGFQKVLQVFRQPKIYRFTVTYLLRTRDDAMNSVC